MIGYNKSRLKKAVQQVDVYFHVGIVFSMTKFI